MKEACGVFGIYSAGQNELAKLAFFGLYALQHRGQESAGMVASDGDSFKKHIKMGLVSQVFQEEDLKKLTGNICVGHVRYSTTGASSIAGAQPIVVKTKFGEIAIAHNGNLVNAKSLTLELLEKGYKFNSDTDSEVIAALIETSEASDLETAMINAFKKCLGAFSLVVMTKDKLYGARDPYGIRPLCVGRLDDRYFIVSESCALDIVGAKYVRDVVNGELVVIDKNGISSRTWDQKQTNALCVFEFIYFSRPDSMIEGRNVYDARVTMGKYLAKEHPVDADIVVAIPDSGIPASIGYAEEAGIPFSEGLIKNRYVGRTFIEPSQMLRELGVRLKLNPIRDAIRGKKVLLIDDSIVRGTTSKQIVKMMKEVGAREVHMRVSSPQIVNPCFYGIDTATRAELIAANLSVEGIRRYLGADSLGYLSIKSLVKAIALSKNSLCLACLNGKYPVKIPERLESLKLLFQ